MTGGRVLSIQTCISISSSRRFIIFQLVEPLLLHMYHHITQDMRQLLLYANHLQIWARQATSVKSTNNRGDTQVWLDHPELLSSHPLQQCQRVWKTGLAYDGNNWILSALYAGSGAGEYKYLSCQDNIHIFILLDSPPVSTDSYYWPDFYDYQIVKTPDIMVRWVV